MVRHPADSCGLKSPPLQLSLLAPPSLHRLGLEADQVTELDRGQTRPPHVAHLPHAATEAAGEIARFPEPFFGGIDGGLFRDG